MNTYLQDHAQRKEKVLAFLYDVIEVLKQQDNITSADALTNLAKNVEKGLFSIVLVGEFSAGKSTFLNALMGKRILPSFTSETTATVNFLRHKDKAPNGEAGIVYYNDGHQEPLADLSLDTIANVVSTKSDKGKEAVAATIDHVDLFLESEYLKNGIMLVDSPGLNGIAANHLEITRKQIEQSHAAIFMFSADHPGSKSDFQHLEELKSKSKNIFFVLNKINIINPEEGFTVENVIDSLKESYHKKFPYETEIPKIWPVAANAALVARDENCTQYLNGEVVKDDARREELEEISRLSDFEARLMEYLTTGERTRDQLLQPVKNSLEQLKIVKETLEQEEMALSKEESPQQLLQEKEAIEEQLKKLNQEKKNISQPIQSKVNISLRNLKSEIGSQIEKIRNGVNSELELLDDAEDLKNYASGLEDSLNKKYTRLINDFKDDMHNEIVDVVQEGCSDYFEDLNSKFETIVGAGSTIEMHKNFEIKEINLIANIDQFNKQIEELDKKISELEDEEQALNLEKIKVQQREEEIIELKSYKRELEQRRNYILDNTSIPPIVNRREQVEYYRDRNGFGGRVAQLFSGPKKDTKFVTVVDSNDHDQALSERDVKIKDIDAKIADNREALDKLDAPGNSSAEIKLMLEQNEKYRGKLLQKILDLNEKLQNKIEENSRKECRALKKQIKDYVENRGDDLSKELKKELDSMKNEYLVVVNELVTMNIENELKHYQQKLKTIIAAINTTGKEREEKLTFVKSNLELVRGLMQSGSTICSELEETLQNTIEQETLN